MSAENSGWFYYHQAEETFGPLPLAELEVSIKTGTMRPDALVCQAGEDVWSTIPQHPLLSETLSAILTEQRREAELYSLLNRVIITKPNERDRRIDQLGRIVVFYGSKNDSRGPISLWQVVDMIDAKVLPIDTAVCVEGSDYWRDAVVVSARAIGLSV
jgi:hypothetical protein